MGSKRKKNKNCTKMTYEETFYRHHTACWNWSYRVKPKLQVQMIERSCDLSSNCKCESKTIWTTKLDKQISELTFIEFDPDLFYCCISSGEVCDPGPFILFVGKCEHINLIKMYGVFRVNEFFVLFFKRELNKIQCKLHKCPPLPNSNLHITAVSINNTVWLQHVCNS